MRMTVQKLIVAGWRLRRSTGWAGRWVTMALVVASGFLVAAQEPDAFVQTNDVITAEVLARISELVQSAESGQIEEMALPNDLTPTNSPPQAEKSPVQTESRSAGVSRPENSSRSDSGSLSRSPSRSQKDDRRSRGRRSLRSRSDQTSGSGSANDYSRGSDRTQTNAPAGTNGSLTKLDYAAFKIIVDRNIFDPNRYPRRTNEPPVRPTPKSAEYVTLVGTMSYEKGSFAFFDGTSSDCRKALKLADAIVGYKVTRIAPNGVKLAAGTNELELRVGAQMRREEDGPWLLASQSRPYAATPASTATNTTATTSTTVAAGSDATSGGAESDIIKRLMQKREQE